MGKPKAPRPIQPTRKESCEAMVPDLNSERNDGLFGMKQVYVGDQGRHTTNISIRASAAWDYFILMIRSRLGFHIHKLGAYSLIRSMKSKMIRPSKMPLSPRPNMNALHRNRLLGDSRYASNIILPNQAGTCSQKSSDAKRLFGSHQQAT